MICIKNMNNNIITYLPYLLMVQVLNVSANIRRIKISIFRKAFKSVGKMLGISGSSSPTVTDPIKQEAEQKRLAQEALNTQTAKAVQKSQANSINPTTNTGSIADSTTNAEANKTLNPTPQPFDKNKWRVIKYVANSLTRQI